MLNATSRHKPLNLMFILYEWGIKPRKASMHPVKKENEGGKKEKVMNKKTQNKLIHELKNGKK